MEKFSRGIDPVSVERYKEETKGYVEFLKQKEEYWRQRAKLHWLRETDQNSKFFHVKASVRKKRNRIIKLKHAEGNWCCQGQGLEELILHYYTDLFTSQGVDDRKVCSKIHKGITEEQNQLLLAPFYGYRD